MQNLMSEIFTLETIVNLVAITALLIVGGFFSISETALTAASQSRIHTRATQGSKGASIVARLLESRERLIGALLLGNNLVNIMASALMTGLMLTIFGDIGAMVATGVMTALIVIFGEVLPKTYAITRPDEASITVARPVSLVVLLFAPVVSAIQVLVNGILRLFGVKPDTVSWTMADEIRGAVNLHTHEGRVDKSERDQILGVLNIGDLSVEDVMIHRKNLVMIDADLNAATIVKQVLESGHSRVPLWRGEKDNVIGVLHAKDLLGALSRSGGEMKGLNIDKLLRTPWFVPETTSVLSQLRMFQKKRIHFALVVDEYGALMGVVTLEDIVEEIVGDIQDEFDENVEGVKMNKDGSVIVAGDVPVRDLNRACDWDLPDDDAVTIAGLIIHETQSIPDVGQEFSFHNHRFEVLVKQRNQITSLKVRKMAERK